MYDPAPETIQRINDQMPSDLKQLHGWLSAMLTTQVENTTGLVLLAHGNNFVKEYSVFTLAELLATVPGQLTIRPIQAEAHIVIEQTDQRRTTRVVNEIYQEIELILEQNESWSIEQKDRFSTAVNKISHALITFDGIYNFTFIEAPAIDSAESSE